MNVKNWFALTSMSVLLTGFWLVVRGAAQSTPASEFPYEVIYTNGTIISPAQITRPAGPFLLVIKNSSSAKNLVIHVKQHAGPTAVAQADLDSRGGNYAAVIDVPPGTYDIWEPGHPKMTCTLTIK